MSDPSIPGAVLSSRPQTTDQLADAFLAWAGEYYRKPMADDPSRRRPTGETRRLRQALVALRAVAGTKPARDLRAEDLYEAQAWMIQRGLCRDQVNARINCMRRCVKWATKPPRRWLPIEVLTDLQLTEPVRAGRSDAAEAPGVKAVDWERVTSTMAVAAPELALMIELQWWTGMRPCEVVGMRRSWLHPAMQDPEIYRPLDHKCAHHNIERVIPIGPNARQILRAWLHRMRPGVDRLWSITTTSGYTQAIARTNKRHDLPHWSPLQVRHAFATRVEREAGEATAQKLLGHTTPDMTRRYIDRATARELTDLGDHFG